MHAEREDEIPPDENDEARQRRLHEERIRALQFDQIPLEGGRPKARVSLFSAYLVSLLAMILPLKVRTAFALAINFVFNQTAAIFRFMVAWLSRGVTGVAIWLVYWLVVGPTALFARLIGKDDLRIRPVQGSMFQDKEPPDTTEQRFERQY